MLLVGMHDAQALAIYLLVALLIWRRAHRASFDKVIGRRVHSGWVRWWVYERRWRNTMLLSGLGKRMRMREAVPKIAAVASTRCGDRVFVRLLLGQCTEDYERAAPELAHSFGASSCRVREDRPGHLWLEFTAADPLRETVPALVVPENVDLEAVPIGLQENGEPWRVKVLGLCWAHVRERTLLIERAVSLGVIGETKTRAHRTVRLLAPLREDLLEWRLRAGRPRDVALVFPGSEDGPWGKTTYDNWRKRAFDRACKAIGLDGARPYDLRHSFASLLLHEGRSVTYVARQLGHDARLTLGTYGHVIDELDDAPRVSAEDAIQAARRASCVSGVSSPGHADGR